MFGERSFFHTQKSPEQLGAQVDQAQKYLGSEPEVSLIPPSFDREQILQMSLADLREKYARRYNFYLDMLRKQRNEDFVSRDLIISKFKKWLVALNSLDAYIVKHERGTDVTLRGRQINVFEDLRNFLEAGGIEGYVSLPTGVGKTVLFTEFVEALNLKTLIVVPTNILLDQVGEKMDEFAQDIDLGKINKSLKQYGRHVTAITYSSLARQISHGEIKPEDYECLILDEAHEALSDARKEMVGKFVNAVKIGFTATPNFSERKKLSDLLLTEIHSMKIREAIEEGMLCSVSAVIAKTTADLSKVRKNETDDFSESELERAVNIASRNKAAVQLFQAQFSDERAVAYCVGIKHAEVVAKEFREAGVTAAVISGKTSAEEQRELLMRFKIGDIKVLCNADLLIQGFDEPKASVCLNLRPTASRIVAEQRAGRVLRIDLGRPDKHATVIDFLDEYGEAAGVGNLAPVLFPEILGSAFCGPRNIEEGTPRAGGERDRYASVPIIDIPGLEVIFDAEEVMRIIARPEPLFDEKKLKDLRLLQEIVKSLGIRSATDYESQRKSNHPEWPSEPYTLPGWTDWYDFLGKKKSLILRVKKITDLEQLKREVRDAGVTSEPQYKRERKSNHPEWPANPYTLEGWKDAFDFFSKEKPEYVEKIKTIDDLKESVRSAGITSHTQYKIEKKNHPEWPSEPYNLPDWKNWYDLFGKEKPDYKAFYELRNKVRIAGIRTKEDYKIQREKHPDWPESPEELPGWRGWPYFFKERMQSRHKK